MRPLVDPVVALRKLGRRRTRAADDWAAPTPIDPRLALPLSERTARTETLSDGTVLTFYSDPPLGEASVPMLWETAEVLPVLPAATPEPVVREETRWDRWFDD